MTEIAIALPQATFKPAANGRPRWTIELVYKAAEAGMFGAWDQYELIDGELLYVSPPAPRHQGAVRKIVKLLRQAIAAREDLDIDIGAPTELSESDVPIPDVALIQADNDEYTQRHPSTDEVYLVIEVANSHPERDRTQKKERYAKFGLQEYWVVDLQKSELVIYREPDRERGDYQSVEVWKQDRIQLARLPDIEIDTAKLRRRIFESKS